MKYVFDGCVRLEKWVFRRAINKVTISFRDVLHVNLITFQPWSPIWACNSSLFGACLSCPAGELRCISWSWQICDIFLSNDLYNLVQLYCSRQTFFFFFLSCNIRFLFRKDHSGAWQMSSSILPFYFDERQWFVA